jgi:6-phosphofructokinase 1
MKRTLLLAHGGGPTAVLNASLYGAIARAKESGVFSTILASRRGIASGAYIDLTSIPEEKLALLPYTPGSAIGTGRTPITSEGYETLAKEFSAKGITDVLLSGGNGTMDTTRKLAKACLPYGILVCGIPKTMDNDLSGTDHTPGFPSAARYLAGSVREVAQDVKGLAIHVVIIEAFGRDAGWITASSALAREMGGDAPDMIMPPEEPFEEARFLSAVQDLYDRKKGVIVIASEGLKYADGTPIVDPVFKVGRSVYYGDVSAHLSQLVTKELGIKSRNEKPGILGRASEVWVSDVDRTEAISCGRMSTEALLTGKSGWMSSIQRRSTTPYRSEVTIGPIVDEVLKERTLPEAFLDREHYDVTDSFVEWVRPLVGEKLGHFVSFI